jgi:hypothetical protein
MTDLVPTREHEELAKAVKSLLSKRSLSLSKGFDQDLWFTLCDQIGAAALAIPEEHGGAGEGVVGPPHVAGEGEGGGGPLRDPRQESFRQAQGA